MVICAHTFLQHAITNNDAEQPKGHQLVVVAEAFGHLHVVAHQPIESSHIVHPAVART